LRKQAQGKVKTTRIVEDKYGMKNYFQNTNI